jgi:4-nitrophenyl phosphatase
MSCKIPDNIRGVILDMDGVLWRDDKPIGNLSNVFANMQERGWQVMLATNNATQTADQYIQKLAGFGVKVEREQIINSAQATAQYLQQRFPDGGSVFIVGEQGLVTELERAGFSVDPKDALAVVVGMDRKVTYDKLKIATLLIRSGVPFIATNPDKTFPSPEGLVPGAGTFVAAIQAASDQQPIIVGKPEPEMYQQALKLMGLKPADVLVVGDRLETDIAGAQKIDCPTALVLSGVTTREQADAWKPEPDCISEDLSKLLGL